MDKALCILTTKSVFVVFYESNTSDLLSGSHLDHDVRYMGLYWEVKIQSVE